MISSCGLGLSEMATNFPAAPFVLTAAAWGAQEQKGSPQVQAEEKNRPALHFGLADGKDESGILDDGEIRNKTIFGEQYLPGTTALIKEWFNRHLILRANPRPEDLAD